jgi:hypothetical protein
MEGRTGEISPAAMAALVVGGVIQAERVPLMGEAPHQWDKEMMPAPLILLVLAVVAVVLVSLVVLQLRLMGALVVTERQVV